MIGCLLTTPKTTGQDGPDQSVNISETKFPQTVYDGLTLIKVSVADTLVKWYWARYLLDIKLVGKLSEFLSKVNMREEKKKITVSGQCLTVPSADDNNSTISNITNIFYGIHSISNFQTFLPN